MVLVDTSVWVSHLRRHNLRLENLLSFEFVYCHPLIIAELACGHLNNRREILLSLQELPSVKLATDEDILVFIEKHSLYGKGLGVIDIHLLASCMLSHLSLWTEDKSLQKAADRLGIFYR